MDVAFDVLVIGGGIIGAAAGQHIASAGYKTLLVESNDYASGTSSRTSRMHNCGFMYFVDGHNSVLAMLRHPIAMLKSMELARRTMLERAAFVTTSPDRVRKLEFYIPFDKHRGVSAVKLRLAAGLLRLLGGGGVSLEPRFLGAKRALANPLLALMGHTSSIDGAFAFAEYQYAWPERIVVDTIMKGRAAGLDARNYTRVVGLKRLADCWEATLQSDDRRYSVTAKAIVNAAGAWVDQVTKLAMGRVPPLNVGAKGVNLMVRLPPEARGFGMETVTARGTPFYVMPWGDLHYMGPADSRAEANDSQVHATDSEIAQILSDANQLFPKLGLSATDVVYSWAGVRPRTWSPGMELGSLEVREHSLAKQGLPDFFVFTGGLIMTHRDAGRRLLKCVRRSIQPSRPPIPVDYRLSSLPSESEVTRDSVFRAIEAEQARTLVDVLRRRLSVGWDADLGLSQLESAAEFAAEALNWSSKEKARQVERYRSEVRESFRPRPGLLDTGAPGRLPQHVD